MGVVCGRDCYILFRVGQKELTVPYSEETIREAEGVVRERACIEGDGVVRALRQRGGAAGCVVTPLTMSAAPLVLGICFGGIGEAVFVSGSRHLYRRHLVLKPYQDCGAFDLIQHRGGEGRLFGGCFVRSFSLRINKGEALKVRIDVGSSVGWVSHNGQGAEGTEGERFKEDGVTYKINGAVTKDIYALKANFSRGGSVSAEVFIHRVLKEADLPDVIDAFEIDCLLMRDCYEERRFGRFSVRFERLLKMADETVVDCADGLIGPVRYFCTGGISSEIFLTETRRHGGNEVLSD
jgi:hypothetical protein